MNRYRYAWVATAFLALAGVQTAAAEDLVPWRHGTLIPKGDAGFIYMAAEGGFAEKQGLGLKMLAFQGDTLMFKALIAGELDSFEGSPISPMVAGSKGADVKIVGCSWPKLTYSLFSREDIGSVADLKGKVVGISAPGSLPELVARTMLKRSGVAPSDVKFVMAGSDPERIRAIVAKTIDAAISTSDFAARRELGLKSLALANQVLPQFVRMCIITRGDLVRTRSEHLVRLLAAEMAAYGYALCHRDAVVALTRRVTNLPASDPTPETNFSETVEQEEVAPTLDIDLAKLRWLRGILAEDGRLAADFDPAALVDMSIRQRAAQRLEQR